MLRQWREEDIKKLQEIAKESFIDPWTYEMFSGAYNAPVFYGLISEEEGEIAGYLAMSVVLDEANVDDVAVSAAFRRKGLARQMLIAAENELKTRGVKTLFLEVRRSNVAAINLYSSLGFSVMSKRYKYYGDEDALIMTKIIKE